MKKPIIAVAAAAFFALAGVVVNAAQLADFRAPEKVAAGDPVTAMAITPNDRYVVMLSGQTPSGYRLTFFDTWDFSMLEGNTARVQVCAGSTEALDLTVAVDGEYAYVSTSTGELVSIAMAGLYALTPADRLLLRPAKKIFMVSSNQRLSLVQAIPEVTGSLSYDYVLAAAPAANRLYWVRLQNGGASGVNNPFSFTYKPRRLAASRQYGFNLFEPGLGSCGGLVTGYCLEAISCYDGSAGCSRQDVEPIDNANTIGGLGVDQVGDDFAVMADLTDHLFLSYQTYPFVNSGRRDTLPSNLSGFVDLDLLSYPIGLGDVAAAAHDATVTLAEIDPSTFLFESATVSISGSDPFVSLVASGGTDGYIYIADSGNNITPITANPWVDDLFAVSGNTVVDLNFTALSPAAGNLIYSIFRRAVWKAWRDGAELASDATTAGDSVTAEISYADLRECGNVLTVLVKDADGREGRNAVVVFKDTAPPKPGFKLDFGDSKLIVSFTVKDPCDLDRYELFYGRDPTLYATRADLAAAAGLQKIVFKEPPNGDDISRTLSGLQNGARYYVYLVIVDETGNATVSDRKSSVPEPVLTLTQEAGEDGGVNCLGSVSARPGDPASACWLLLPLMAAAAIRIFRRCY